MNLICPHCKQSREVYDVIEKDKKKKKWWKITRCQKCAYNFDIEEANEPKPKPTIPPPTIRYGPNW